MLPMERKDIDHSGFNCRESVSHKSLSSLSSLVPVRQLIVKNNFLYFFYILPSYFCLTFFFLQWCFLFVFVFPEKKAQITCSWFRNVYSEAINLNSILTQSDHKKKCSFEDPFEAASVYSLNPQVLSVTALPHNPLPTKSNTHIHTN